MQPTQELVATATEIEGNSSTSQLKGPSVKTSVLQKYLSVRGRKAGSKSSIPTKLTAESLSKTYTKRRYGNKAEVQRAAIREPGDIFSESLDAYVPKKREQELMNFHHDELEVNQVFLTETRALSFERQVLDKVVCDREENRNVFEERIWCLLANDRGLQQVEDGENQKEQEKKEEVGEEQVE